LYILIFRFFFLYKMGRQKILDWIIASIPQIQSFLDFITDVILIC
jgi:hypothetical protein